MQITYRFDTGRQIVSTTIRDDGSSFEKTATLDAASATVLAANMEAIAQSGLTDRNKEIVREQTLRVAFAYWED